MSIMTLNAFQQFMQQWSQVVPYNSVHVIEIQGQPDSSQWQKAILALLQEMNLGIPHFSKKGRKVFFSPITAVSIETPSTPLEEHINNEMNRRFESNELPLRFFYINSANDTYFFGVTYNHWIADANAIHVLLHRLVSHYQNQQIYSQPLTLDTPKFNALFRNHIGRFSFLKAIAKSIRAFFNFSSAHRIKLANLLDFQSHSIYRPLPQDTVNKLHHFAKTQNATINDVFLSVLAKTLGELTAEERKNKKAKFLHRKRGDLALGTIVNIRNNARENLQRVFGMYLSSYTIILKAPEKHSIAELLKIITARTTKIKRNLAFIKDYPALSLATLLCKIKRRADVYLKFFYKHTPVAGGVSNVNFTESWKNESIKNYLRISPAGPLLPLVFSLTTLEGRLSLWMTYRTAAFTQQQAEKLCDAFTHYLTKENLL